MATMVADARLGELQSYADISGNEAWLMILLKKDGLSPNEDFAGYVTVADVLANNTEADFTNYARKTTTSVSVNVTSGESVAIDIPTQTWSSAGGSVDNEIGKAVVAYDPDTTSSSDSDRLLLVAFDAEASTNGKDLIVRIHDDALVRYTQGI